MTKTKQFMYKEVCCFFLLEYSNYFLQGDSLCRLGLMPRGYMSFKKSSSVTLFKESEEQCISNIKMSLINTSTLIKRDVSIISLILVYIGNSLALC